MPKAHLAFTAAFLITIVVAWAMGKRDERVGATLMLGAAFLTPLVQNRSFHGVEFGIVAVDVTLMFGLGALSLRSTRWWPMAATAFQAAACITHLARYALGTLDADAYGHAAVFWSYPVLLSLLLGTMLERVSARSQTSTASLPGAAISAYASENGNGLVTESEVDVVALTKILVSHNVGAQAYTLASRIIDAAGGLSSAFALSPLRLRSLGGGQKTIRALSFMRETIELSLRQEVSSLPILNSSSSVTRYLHGSMAHLVREEFRVLFLNSKYHLIKDEIVALGSAHEAPVYPREIARRSLELGATNLVLAHNHPSGNPEPSREDIKTTYALAEAVTPLGINIIDHIIIGKAGYCSLVEDGHFSRN